MWGIELEHGRYVGRVVRRWVYLMSAISAECLTRPQYVERSYLESGSGREPGNEEDMFAGENYTVKNGTEYRKPK
jgi:hypothetical protein